MEKIVWVLGSKHLNAHKSISWDSPFPNFSNCDILIINLQSLDSEQFKKRWSELFNEARKYILDLLMTGEKEVFIISSSNQNMLEWLPIYPYIRKMARGEIGDYNVESPADEYMKMVEHCPYYIHDFDFGYAYDMTNPESEHHENYPFTSKARQYQRYFDSYVAVYSKIRNKAKQLVGGSFRYLIMYGYEGAERFVSGMFHFLPSPTRCTAEQAVDIMVNILTGGELIESPPPWENKIDLPGLQDVQRQIIEKEGEKEILIKGIEEMKQKKDKMIKFRRLLWTKGAPLENIVKEAFIFLGFPEIRKIREKNLEDWIIDFNSIPKYKHGVFEIKGADERTSLADLTQCNKWVEDYLLDQKVVKGIFVPNQYRLVDVRTNQEKKEHFEKNELHYAETRDICILPSHAIFYAVVEKMRGNSQITRKIIEERIASAKGICKISKT